jgi:hypothetical protein
VVLAQAAQDSGTAATSVLSYVGTLVAGVLTGAIGGAVVTTSHERSERFRERMIVAANGYLDALDGYIGALHTGRQAILQPWREHRVGGDLATTSLGRLCAGRWVKMAREIFSRAKLLALRAS